MAAIQVKHAENEQLQNKNPTAEKNKTKLRSHRNLGEKMLQSSANQAFRGIIFNIYCTIIEDDSGCLMV